MLARLEDHTGGGLALCEPAQGQSLSLAPAFEGQSYIGKPDMPVPIDRIAPNTRAGRRRDRRVRRRLVRRRYQGQQPVPSRIHRHDGRASHEGRHAMDARVLGMQRELLRPREKESIWMLLRTSPIRRLSDSILIP
jgi:hypothetical protein